MGDRWAGWGCGVGVGIGGEGYAVFGLLAEVRYSSTVVGANVNCRIFGFSSFPLNGFPEAHAAMARAVGFA